jgi:hypothetical protein
MKPEEKIEEVGKKALAHNQAVQTMVHGYGDKDIHLVRVIATYNPKLAEAREVVTKYIKESEDMQILISSTQNRGHHPKGADAQTAQEGHA